MHRLALAASLIFLLTAGSARAHSDATGIETGELRLALTPGQPSYLIENGALFEGALCGGGSGHNLGPVVVGGDGGGNRAPLALRVLEHEHLTGGAIALAVLPYHLALVGPAPIETSCGTWIYRLELDAQRAQPISELLLVPDPDQPSMGTFQGIVPFAARYRVTSLETGAVRSVARQITLLLSGSWALAEAAQAPPGASNLALLATPVGGLVTAAPADAPEGDGGLLHLTADPTLLEALNAGSIQD